MDGDADDADTPRRPAPPTPTAASVKRVGGGYEWRRSERYTEALAAAATYNTYRALPREAGALAATDVAVLAEILKAAEAEVDAAAGGTASPTQQASLPQVLRAHQWVLRSAGMDPEQDTRYYRTLLRLSLDQAEPDWWGRLFREISSNSRQEGGVLLRALGLWSRQLDHPPCRLEWPSLPAHAGMPLLNAPFRGPHRHCTHRRFAVPPEQQQLLMHVLLSCRVGGPGGADVEGLQPAQPPGPAEWAQTMVAASRPTSAAAMLRPGWSAAPTSPPSGGALWRCSDGCPAGPAPEPGALAEPVSYGSLPPGLDAEAQQATLAGQLEAAVQAWQQHAGSAPVEASLKPQHDFLAARLQQAVEAWQQATVAASAAAATSPVVEGKAGRIRQPPVEDAIAGWPAQSGLQPHRPHSPASPQCGVLRVLVPALASPPPGQPPMQQAGQAASVAQPPSQTPCRCQQEEQSATKPGSRLKHGLFPCKYPQIYPAPVETASIPALSAVPTYPTWDGGRGCPESPRILSYPPAAAMPLGVLPAGVAQAQIPPAPDVLRVVAAEAAAVTSQPPTLEQSHLLADCLQSWHELARSASAAQRVAELRETARAEDLRDALLLRLHFRLWRCRKQAMLAAVLSRVGSARQRHAFLRWRAATQEASERGRRASLHYASSSMRLALKAWQLSTAARRSQSLKLQAAVAHWQGNHAGTAFSAWRSAAFAGAALQELAVAHHLRRCRSAHLRAWRAAARGRRTRRGKVQCCLAHLMHRQAACCLTHWRELVCKQRIAQRCAARLSQRQLGAALAAWRAWAARRQGEQELLAACLQRMLLWRLAAAFQHWRQRVAAAAEGRARLGHCVGRLRHGTLSRAWGAWQDFAALHRAKAARLQAAVRHWSCISAAAAFATWRVVAGRQRQLRNSASAVVARWRRLQLTAALAAWRQRHGEQLRKQACLRACVARLQGCVVARAYAGWRAAVHQRAELRCTAERCLLRLSQLSLARAWWQWQAYAQGKAAQRATVESFQPRRKARMLRLFVASWQEAVAGERRMRRVMARLQRGTASRALQHWKLVTKQRRQLSAIMLQVAGRIAKGSSARAFATWRAWLEERRSKAASLQLAVNAWRCCRLRAAFACWQNRVQQKQQQLARLRRAAAALLHSRLHTAWAGWRAAVERRREATVRIQAAVHLWQRSHLGRAFRSWRQRHSCWQQHAAKVQMAVTCWQTISLRAAWAAWQRYVQERRSNKGLLCEPLSRLTNLRAAAAFDGWRAAAAWQRTRARMLQRAAAFWLNRSRTAAFASWREHALERRAKKQLLSRVAVFIVNRSLAAGFATWRDVATDRGAARQRAAGALAKLQSQRLWASFAAWSAAVQARCNKRMQLAQVLAHWQQASLARAWRAWREGARAQQAKVAKLLAAARRWHQPLLSSAFLAWAEIVRDRRHLTERLHQAAVHWLHAAQASAFNTWRHQAWKARAARKAAACFAGQTCAKAFRSWRAHREHCKILASRLDQAIGRWRSGLSAAAFSAWQAAAQQRRYERQVLATAVALLRSRDLSLAFACWQQHVADQRQRAAQLALAVGCWRQAALRAAWFSWQEFSMLRRAKEQQVAAALQLWQGCALRAAWAGWSKGAAEQRARRERMRAAVHLWHSSRLRAGWASWREACTRQREKQANAQAAVRLWQNSRLHSAWRAWAAHHSFRQRARAVATRLLHSKLAAAFTSWRCEAGRRSRLACTLAAALQRWHHQTLASAFTAWRDRLPAWRLKAQQLELAGGHWTHATQAGTFQRWRDSLAEQQRQRRALARFTRATQARAWATWRSYVVERRGRQAKLQAAVNWWLRGTLCSAFSQWRGAASQRAQQRDKVAACLSKLLNRQLLAALNQWRSYAAYRRAKHLADTHRKRHLLAVSLAAFWRPLELKAIATACLARMLNRQLASAFTGWRERTAASKEAAEAAMECGRRAALRMQHGLLAGALASWRQHAALRRKARQVLLRIQRRGLVAALHSWRECATRVAAARVLMQRSLMGTQQWAFAAWREAAAAAAEQSWALQQVAYADAAGRTTPKKLVFELAGQPRLALLMGALGAWRGLATARRQARSQVLRAYRHLYFWLARRCVDALRCHAQAQRRLRAAAAAFTHSCRLRAWRSWRSHMHHKRAAASKLQRAVELWAGNTTAQAWHCWRSWAAACRQIQQHSRAAAIHYDRWLLRQALEALSAHALRRREQRALDYRAVGHMQGFRLALLFTAWRSTADRQAALRSAVQHLLACTTAGRLQRVVMMWRWYTARQRYLRQITHTFTLRRLGWCVRSWREATQLSAYLRSVCALAASKHLARTTQQVFDDWRRQAQQQRRQHELLAMAAVRLRSRSLFAAWNAWRSCMTAQRAQRQQALAVLQRIMRQLRLAAALSSWRAAATNASSKRQLALRALGHLAGNLQRRAFDTWHSSVAEGRTDKQRSSILLLKAYLGWQEVLQCKRSLQYKAQVVVRQLAQRELAATFRGWQARVGEARQLRRSAALLVSTLQQRSQRAAFNAWGQHVQRRRAAAAAVQRALGGRAQRSLGACLAGWRDAGGMQRRERLLVQQAVGRLVQRQLSQAFVMWRQVASNRQRCRQLVAGALQRMGSQRLADSFGHWRQWAAQKHRLAAMQRGAVAALHARQLAACTKSWQMMAHTRAVAKRCLAAMRLQRLRQAFTSWQAAAEDGRAAAAAAALVPAGLRRWLGRWRTAVQLTQRKRQRVERAAAWAFGSSRQRAWKAWALHHRHQRKKQAAQRLFVTGTLRRYLAAWQEQVAQRHRLAVKQQHLVGVFSHRRLADTLLQWQRAVRAHRFARRFYSARAFAAWAENCAAAKGKRETLRHAVNLLANGQLARYFTAWRADASAMVLKRAVFARKQAALREALRIGDAIIRRRRSELLTAAFGTWRTRAAVAQSVQQRFAQHLQGSLRAAFLRWRAYHETQVEKHRLRDAASQHCAASLQRRALAAWAALLAEEQRRRVALADAFARGRRLQAAWQQWVCWMDLQCLRRQRLAVLLGRMDASSGVSLSHKALAAHSWRCWQLALEQRRRLEEWAGAKLARKQAALLEEIFSVWAAYTRAMRAEYDPGSPYASPRAREADGQLIWDVAEMVAGDLSSSASAGCAGASTVSRAGSSAGGSSSRSAPARAPNAQPVLAAEQAEHGQVRAAEPATASSNAGAGSRRWRLRGLARNLAGAFNGRKAAGR